jgi:3-deoxy-manno-octulosonate cytidylyltransferase (CMP-KDO synthetase)
MIGNMTADKQRIIGIIPARWGSTRFPGKPLAVINGKPMIQRVYEQVVKSLRLNELVIATDDERIILAVNGFGGKAILTGNHHRSGTERCAEVIEKFEAKGAHFDIAINVQGDEPYINPKQIDQLASCFADEQVDIATLIKKIDTQKDLFNPNVVKVIHNNKGDAIYFSREAIPHLRNHERKDWLHQHSFFKHIGIYAYRVTILKELVELVESDLELAESLEQLRWIGNEFNITVRETEFESIAIDTPEDLLKILNKT